jgi:multidrug resistance efflux pump
MGALIHLRTWRGAIVVADSTRRLRKFPWARITLFALLIAAAAYLVVPNYFFANADALIRADLVPVAPIYRARIDRLYVQCGDQVKAGQKLALISNFLVQADYARQYEQATEQLQLSKIALDEGLTAARTEEEAAHQRYLADNIEASRLGDQFRAYDRAYQAGAIGHAELQAKEDAWRAAQALAESTRNIWTHAQEHIQRIESNQKTKLASEQETSERSRALADRTAGETVVAPINGYIVNCIDREQNIVEAGAKMFDIFDTDHAYALAYFSPNVIANVRIGAPVNITIRGSVRPLTGRVAAIYPNLAKLPDQLTRFFWQHVQWSEYRPVRIAFDRIPNEARAQLYYDAQARARIPLRDLRHARTP